MARRNDIDKEAVERDYRAGQLSYAAICKAHEISKSTLSRFIEEGKWERDLTEAVKVATRAKIVKATIQQQRREKVAEKVEALVEDTVEESAETIAAGVEMAAAANVQIVMGHRRDITRLKSLAGGLFAELNEVVGKPAELRELIDAVRDQDPDALPAVMKFASLANRVGTAERLTKTFSTLIALERQAFGLDEDGKNNADSSIEDVLRAVHGLK